MSDIVERLGQGWSATEETQAHFVTVDRSEWFRCTSLTREAATEIVRLREEAQSLRDRNTKLLSKLQEYEAREY